MCLLFICWVTRLILYMKIITCTSADLLLIELPEHITWNFIRKKQICSWGNSFENGFEMLVILFSCSSVNKNYNLINCRPLPWGKRKFCINTLRPRQNWRRFTDDLIKCIFLNENIRISIICPSNVIQAKSPASITPCPHPIIPHCNIIRFYDLYIKKSLRFVPQGPD